MPDCEPVALDSVLGVWRECPARTVSRIDADRFSKSEHIESQPSDEDRHRTVGVPSYRFGDYSEPKLSSPMLHFDQLD